MNNEAMDNELRDLEGQLGKLSPMSMPEDMLARMEQAMDRWCENIPAEEKIVPFQSYDSGRRSSRFYIWASAAVVALIGAVSTMVMTPDNIDRDASSVVTTDVPADAGTVQAPLADHVPGVVNVGNSKFDTKILDEPTYSITYDSEGRPHRLVKVRFEDEITLYDGKGRPVTVRKPRIEYYLVPVRVH